MCHGEGALKGEVVMFGCTDGVLLFDAGAFTKLDAPDDYGRSGNAYVSETSAIAAADYNADPDSEGYFLSQLALIDTDAQSLSVVDLPDGVEYTWRGVGRDAHDNIIVLGSDGSLTVLDESGAVQESWPVIDPWESPTEWQQPHPGLRVVGDIAYVTETALNRILAVGPAQRRGSGDATLDVVPNESWWSAPPGTDVARRGGSGFGLAPFAFTIQRDGGCRGAAGRNRPRRACSC